MGPSVSDMFLKIPRGGSIPSTINRIFTALIPKKSNTKYMIDFRPISLCNVVYKLDTKMLANRLEKFLVFGPAVFFLALGKPKTTF